MRTYNLFLDKLINDLTPSFLRGRSHLLWIQSTLFPLQNINDEFRGYTDDKIIEANMSSAVLHFEWYLNRKFGAYMANENEKIKLSHYEDSGTLFFNDGDVGELPNVAWDISDDWSSAPVAEQPQPLYSMLELIAMLPASFKVTVPVLNSLLDVTKFNIIMKAEIEKYRLAGKTYIIENS